MAKEQKKTGFESKYDEARLRQLIEAGKNADEILEALGLASRQSLRQHLLKLITTDQQVYTIKGLDRSVVRRPSVSQKGDVRISKKMMAFSGSTYRHGDEFTINVDNEKIVLTRIVSKSGKVADKSTDGAAAKVGEKTDVKGSTK